MKKMIIPRNTNSCSQNNLIFYSWIINMSIRELLQNCYKTSDDIRLTLEQISVLTLDDIFTMIYLVSAEKCKIHIVDDDKASGAYYTSLRISPNIVNPANLALVYIISDNNYGDIIIDNVTTLKGEKMEFDNQDEFMKMAYMLDMLNYPTVQAIIRAFRIPYKTRFNMHIFISNYLTQ